MKTKTIYSLIIFSSVIFTVLLDGCTSQTNHSANTANKHISINEGSTYVLVATYYKKDKNVNFEAVVTATIVNMDTGKVVRKEEIPQKIGYFLIQDLPPGNYAITQLNANLKKHSKYNMVIINTKKKLEVPHLFTAVKDVITAVGMEYATFLSFTANQPTIMVRYRSTSGQNQVHYLKQFFNEHPEMAVLETGKIEVSKKMNGNSLSRILWDVNKHILKTVISIPTITTTTGSASYTPKTIIIPKDKKGD